MKVAINFLCMNKILNFYLVRLVFICKNIRTYDIMSDRFCD